LLQQYQGIKLSPQFYNLASLEARDHEIFKYNLSAGWGNTQEITLVSAMYVDDARHIGLAPFPLTP